MLKAEIGSLCIGPIFKAPLDSAFTLFQKALRRFHVHKKKKGPNSLPTEPRLFTPFSLPPLTIQPSHSLKVVFEVREEQCEFHAITVGLHMLFFPFPHFV